MGSRPLHVAATVVTLTVACLVGLPSARAGAAPGSTPGAWSARPLAVTARVAGSRAASAGLARSDPALLARTDATPVPVLVKLDYDALASYAGGLAGAPATSPTVTGRPLTRAGGGAYARLVALREAEVTAALTAAVPDIRIERSLRTVYGGVGATLPARDVAVAAAVPGVVAVQADDLRPSLPTTSPPPVGAGGDVGSGTVIATLGTGGRDLRAGPGVPDPGPADPDPLTRGVAAGAPGARVEAYRACGVRGCSASELVAAAEAAVLDGADVVALAASPGADPRTDAVTVGLHDVDAADVVVVAGGTGAGTAPWVLAPRTTAGGDVAATAAGAATLRATHPAWTTAEGRAALELTAGPGGRIDLAAAGDPGLLLAEEPGRLAALAGDPSTRPHLNTPTIEATGVDGVVTVRRTVTNVSDGPATYQVTTGGTDAGSLTVSPERFTVARGSSRDLTVTVAAGARTRGVEGEIRLAATDRPTLRLPVAVTARPAEVTVETDCDRGPVAVGGDATCTVTATNTSAGPTTVAGQVTASEHLRIDSAGAPASSTSPQRVVLPDTVLAGRTPSTPRLEPLGGHGYRPLDALGIRPVAVGDHEGLDVALPAPFRFDDVSYDRIGVSSDGYLVAGGLDGPEDLTCCPTADGADAAPPNGVIAPFWTDLTGEGAPGIYLATVTDGTRSWVVVEWRLRPAGAAGEKTFQVWLGGGHEQDVTLTYPPDRVPTAAGLTTPPRVGAEGEDGVGGDLREGAPRPDAGTGSADLVVVGDGAATAHAVTFSVALAPHAGGVGTVRAEVTAAGAPRPETATGAVRVVGPGPGVVEAEVARASAAVIGPTTEARRRDWADRLRAGTLSREGFGRELARDPAWLGRVVDARYLTLTGSPPDPAGRAFWIGALRDGAGEEQLVGQLIGSDAFFAAAGGDPATFVEQTFLTVVGRPPDPAGRDYWVARLDDGTSRTAMGRAMAALDEVRAQRATDVSRLLQGREPTREETVQGAAELRHGTIVDLVAAIVARPGD